MENIVLSTSIEIIIDKFFKRNVENRERDYVEEKSNNFHSLKDIHRDSKPFNQK